MLRARHLKPMSLWLRAGLLAALLLAVLSTATAAAGDPGKVGYPNSMAAAGDSITRAYNTGWFPYTDAPENSWTTGTNSTVNSHYRRILVNNSLINRKNYNDAKTGSKMLDLSGQVTTINAQAVEYITILLGANDVCTGSEATMTPIDTFRAQFQSAMDALSTGSPNARIFISSIPNIYNLWAIFEGQQQRARDLVSL